MLTSCASMYFFYVSPCEHCMSLIFPMEMVTPPTPTKSRTEIPRYKFTFQHISNLICKARYRKTWVSEVCRFWWCCNLNGNCHRGDFTTGGRRRSGSTNMLLKLCAITCNLVFVFRQLAFFSICWQWCWGGVDSYLRVDFSVYCVWSFTFSWHFTNRKSAIIRARDFGSTKQVSFQRRCYRHSYPTKRTE